MNVGRVENLTKLLVFTSLTAVLLSGVSAQNGNCKDGANNDGVGPADGADPGCAKPYWRDSSEQYNWDSDASTVLGGSSGPTRFIPGGTFRNQNKYEGDAGKLDERYINNPGGDENSGVFGRGTAETNSLSPPSRWNKRTTGWWIFGDAYLVDSPTPNSCGDGVDNGEDATNCPTDVGIAEDKNGDSTESVSEVAGVWEIGTSNANNAIDIHEPRGTKSCDMDSNCGSYSSNGLDKYTGGPNYYINPSNSDQIRELTKPSKGTNTMGQTTDYDITSESVSYISSTGSATDETCSATGDYSCSLDSSSSPTTSHSTTNHNLYDTTPDTDTHSSTTYRYDVTSSGVGYNINQNSGSFSINVDHDNLDNDGSYTEESPSGSTTIEKYSCQKTPIGPSETRTGSCSVSDSGTYTTYSFSSTTIDNGYSTDTKTFKHEEVPDSGWPTSEYLNVNEADTTDDVAGEYSRSVFHQKFGGEGYFSIEPKSYWANGGMDNDPAVGYSTFDLTMEGDAFATKRTSHDNYEPDGVRGQKDAIVAVDESNGVVGTETENSDILGDISRSSIPTSCPGDYTKCIKLIDVYSPTFDKWSNTNGAQNVEFNVAAVAHTSESLSVCRMYQELAGGSTVSCTYENSAAPLPNGPYEDEPDEYQRFMKGPEISSTGSEGGTLSNFPIIHEGRISKPSSCVFSGKAYKEGALVDVGQPLVTEKDTDGNVVTKQSFEVESGSTGREVCVNGKWYDSDSRKANTVSTDEDIVHPDSPQADVPSSGIALEEDCTASPCDDKSGDVYVAPFKEGVPPASANPYIGRDGTNLKIWRQENPVTGQLGDHQGVVAETAEDGTVKMQDGTTYQISDYIINAFDVRVRHNTVQTRSNTDAAEGTGQDVEGVSLSNYPLENSRVDDQDDEWGLTENLGYGIANDGTGYPSGGCYGVSRQQSTDISKTQRVYANSYVREAHVKDSGQSNCREDGQWVNPDETALTVQKGGLSCDLTGQDWGIAVDSGASTGLNYPSCNPPSEGGDGGGGGGGGGGDGGDTGGSTCERPDADFTYKLQGADLLTVDFQDQSDSNGGNIDTWKWTINESEYTSQNPTFTYDSAGDKTVKLKVTKQCGDSDFVSKTVDLSKTGFLQEAGGEKNGTIQKIEAKGSSPVGLVHRGDDICLGTGCPNTTGTPTSKDSDKFVNETGDVMSGSLHTARIYTNETYDICIGNTRSSASCPSVDPPGGPALGGTNVETRTGFSLRVNDIVPKSDDLRIQTQ